MFGVKFCFICAITFDVQSGTFSQNTDKFRTSEDLIECFGVSAQFDEMCLH